MLFILQLKMHILIYVKDSYPITKEDDQKAVEEEEEEKKAEYLRDLEKKL